MQYNKVSSETWKNFSSNEKKNHLNEIIKSFATNFEQSPEEIAELINMRANMYHYSVKNTMLIYAQNPYATYVQSFAAWNKMGYSVKKNSKGNIKIFVPVTTTFLHDANQDKWIQLSKANKELVRQYKNGEIETQEKLDFAVGTVFDISQTTCPPEDYPKLYTMGYPSEQHKKISNALEKYAKQELLTSVKSVEYDSISLRGGYNKIKHEIKLNSRLQDTERLSTLSHELGHAIIHSKFDHKSISQKEFEADALSIMIQTDLGLEPTNSRKYHLSQHYSKFMEENKECENKDEVLEGCLNNIFYIYDEYKSKIDMYIDKELGIDQPKKKNELKKVTDKKKQRERTDGIEH